MRCSHGAQVRRDGDGGGRNEAWRVGSGVSVVVRVLVLGGESREPRYRCRLSDARGRKHTSLQRERQREPSGMVVRWRRLHAGKTRAGLRVYVYGLRLHVGVGTGKRDV